MARWDTITSRGNVVDRRGIAAAAGGISLVGVLVVVGLNLLTGGSATDILRQLEQLQTQPSSQVVDTTQFAGEDSYEVFASTVLGSNNDFWSTTLAQQNKQYTQPELILFRTATESACGTATSDVGPHYCPYDQHIYLDETFFDELTNLLGARGGDVAQAYVISHEVGHHVQNILGTIDAGSSNDYSIKLELQADCFAGLWMNSIKSQNVFEPGEIEEALDAASAVGDDRVQAKVTGQINPETWTHGSSQQRVEWFKRGFDTGEFAECNTFAR